MRRVITPRKTPSSPRQPMGNDGVQIAGEQAANRLGQDRRRSRIEFEGLEVGPLGNVEAGAGNGRDQLIMSPLESKIEMSPR